MSRSQATRRRFLQSTAAGVAAAGVVPYVATASVPAPQEDANSKLTVAAIGVGGRGSGIGHQAGRLGNMVACADVDQHRAEKFALKYGESCAQYQDYRRVLDRKDVEAVTIGTPDHWHTRIAIDAMLAGKDVYCEKPLTLTIDEGKQICRTVKETGRVFQVGTQQRTEFGRNFLKAVAIARSGRLGDKLQAVSSVGTAQKGGPFSETAAPDNLDWNMWLGQAPETPYIKERCHHQFRWWFEYSGGQVTDWGVHHTDIAMWAMGLENTGPTSIEGTGTFDDRKNHFNVAHTFDCKFEFADGQRINLISDKNELILEGDKGKIRVNRGGLTGKPVEEIAASKAQQEWLQGEIERLYRGMPLKGHMHNFFDCIKSRALPISDVYTHHRSVSVCHLANIAMKLGRKLTWDPDNEDFVGDEQASALRSRKQREPFHITV